MSISKKHLPSVARRIRAGEMLMAGATIETLMRELGISLPTAKRYKALVDAGDAEALVTMSTGGRRSVFDDAAYAWISEALNGSPVAFGFPDDRWTDGRLQTVINNRFGVNFSRVYARRIMIKLGFGDRLKLRDPC